MLLEITVIDFDHVGSLKFFALQTEQDFQKGYPIAYLGNIYWKDAKNPQGFGPFENMYDACQHHKWVFQNRSSLEIATEPDNVIYYDFRNKKSIK